MKMMRRNRWLLAVVALWSCVLCLNAQEGKEYTIHMQKAQKAIGYGDILLFDTKRTEDCSFLKHVPDIACDSFAVHQFPINRYRPDDRDNLVFVYVGWDGATKKKYVVVDVNRNQDFSDDAMFSFPMEDVDIGYIKEHEPDIFLSKCVGVQIHIGREDERKFLHVGIDPYGMFSTSLSKTKVLISYADYVEGYAILNGTPVEVESLLSGDYSKLEMNHHGFSFRYKDDKGKAFWGGGKLKDTIRIKDDLYRIDRIQHPDIVLTSLGKAPADSSQISSYFPSVYVKDRKTGNAVHLNESMKGKYVFLNFWASWCGPCINSIPKYKALYDKIRHRKDVAFIGIASETSRSLPKLERIIKEYKLQWENYWIDEKEETSTISTAKKLDVHSYPEYILVDKEGKIVYRDGSSLNTDRTVDEFLKLIGER